MAANNLVFYNSLIKNLSTIPIVHGTVIYCTDSREYFYDINNIIRMQSSKIAYCTTLDDFSKVTPVQYNLYHIEESGESFKYAKRIMTEPFSFIKVMTTDDITEIFDTVEELIPTTIFLGGNKYAPRTLASEVFTNDGSTVEDKLKLVTRVAKAVRSVPATVYKQTVFTIPFPFENYIENNNIVEVRIGSVFINESRYTITGNTLTFINLEDGVDLSREITFVFWYNVSIYNSSNNKIMMDGSFISNRSIPNNRLAGITNNFRDSDPDDIPSSEALFNLYNILSNKIEALSHAYNARAVAGGDGTHLTAKVSNYALKPGSYLELTLTHDILDGANISINGGVPYPIYINDAPVPPSIYLANTTITLKIDDSDTWFNIVSDSKYSIKSYSYSHIATANESTIIFNIPEYIAGLDRVNVYLNNLKLFKGVNYTISGNKITLLNYTTNIDDLYIFEVDKIVKNR